MVNITTKNKNPLSQMLFSFIFLGSLYLAITALFSLFLFSSKLFALEVSSSQVQQKVTQDINEQKALQPHIDTAFHDVALIYEKLHMATPTPFVLDEISVANSTKDTTITANTDGVTNVLIAAKNGSLTDTNIIASINETKKTVTLISIPRDLYWNGRKINSYYVLFKMPGYLKQLETISGLRIDKYALVDMYAFIEVIDILEGVDVCLDHEISDPTYRTVDNGKGGTLHYDAGCHHLNGTEALRIARSRKTSSDFQRASRQQLIIQSFKEKAKSLSFNDIDKITKMSQSVLSKLETNFSLQDVLSYYFRFKDFTLRTNNVISTANILYSTKSEAGAYILLPKDGNWGIIRQFIQQKLSE